MMRQMQAQMQAQEAQLQANEEKAQRLRCDRRRQRARRAAQLGPPVRRGDDGADCLPRVRATVGLWRLRSPVQGARRPLRDRELREHHLGRRAVLAALQGRRPRVEDRGVPAGRRQGRGHASDRRPQLVGGDAIDATYELAVVGEGKVEKMTMATREYKPGGTGWGWLHEKFLALDEIKKGGWLPDGKLIVTASNIRALTLEETKKQSDGHFEIDNFASITSDAPLYSPPFKAAGREWRISVDPRGGDGKGKGAPERLPPARRRRRDRRDVRARGGRPGGGEELRDVGALRTRRSSRPRPWCARGATARAARSRTAGAGQSSSRSTRSRRAAGCTTASW